MQDGDFVGGFLCKRVYAKKVHGAMFIGDQIQYFLRKSNISSLCFILRMEYHLYALMYVKKTSY